MERIIKRHPVFKKYTRDWLHERTGFSKIYLSRVAAGGVPLTSSFIKRVCSKLNLPEEALFSTPCGGPGGCAKNEIGNWLESRCRLEHLSLRKVAAKTGLSHATIADIIKGVTPSLKTIKNLARGLSGDGEKRLALEDKLFVLAGYREEHIMEEYLKIIPLLSPEHQHLIEGIVRELARIEGVEVGRINRQKSREI